MNKSNEEQLNKDPVLQISLSKGNVIQDNEGLKSEEKLINNEGNLLKKIDSYNIKINNLQRVENKKIYSLENAKTNNDNENKEFVIQNKDIHDISLIDEINKTEANKKIMKSNPANNQNHLKNGNGVSTIFQSTKSNKLERDLLSKIVDDITFKKSILDNNNLIKSIKENENKNIFLNLKIEMNLNLFNDKEPNNNNDYKIDTYAKEKTGVNHTMRETEYCINMPIYNNLRFYNKHEDIKVILNQVCNDLIGNIRENKVNNAPKIPLKNEPYKNNFYNLGRAEITFDYLKNPNNKIESQCLLEFLNFIDFNLKNTLSQNNDFTKLYSKYEFLANNLIDNKLFYDILECKNDEEQKSFGIHKPNYNYGQNPHGKDLMMDLELIKHYQKTIPNELRKDENKINDHNYVEKQIYANSDYKNLNKLPVNQNSQEKNKIKSIKESKIKNFEYNIPNKKYKSFNGNYTATNNKTTINSQDIDIINELQSNKINNHIYNNNNNNIYSNANKNSSMKIFKSTFSLNNSNSNQNINNHFTKLNSIQLNPHESRDCDKNKDFISNDSLENNSKFVYCSNLNEDDNKDFINLNKSTQMINRKDNNFFGISDVTNNNLFNETVYQHNLLNQKKLREVEETNRILNLVDSDLNKIVSYENKDLMDESDRIDSSKRKKFSILKITNQEDEIAANSYINNYINLTDQSNSAMYLNKSANKELRKFKTDSIHKKIKVNILKYIKDYIVEIVPHKKIPNLSQDIVTNVNISFNKELLEKKIIDIYVEDFEKNNSEALSGIIEAIKHKPDFNEVMNMKLKDYIVEKYWKSDFHRNKLKRIFDFERREYFLTYVNLDRDFINYFLNNRGNKKKGDKLNKNNDNLSYSTQDLQDN